MAYNPRRAGDGLNNVGARRNAPITNNFVPGGQLAPQNRPQQHPRPQGFQNQSNGNFRPQMQQRMPGPPQQRPQGQVQQRPQGQVQQRPQGQVQQKPSPQKVQQQQQPQQQQQQAPPQAVPVESIAPKEETMQCDVSMEEDEQVKKKPFWAIKGGKVSRKERQRRRNARLSKLLQPKNAVMILNELVKSATYTVTDMPQPSEMNQYTATVLVDGDSHTGHGRSKMEAKSMAAEAALKHIVKNRQFSVFKKDEDGDEKMEVSEDGAPSLPWQHVASFALYKLLNSWGEDPNQTRGLAQQIQENVAGQQLQNKPARKMPENAAHMNPLMLLNQMLPHAQFEELNRSGNPPNVVFTFKCTIDGQTFNGKGSNKKSAKKMTAFAVCHRVLGIQYPPEVYTPATN